MQVIYGTKAKTANIVDNILNIDVNEVKKVNSFSYLGVILDENMTYKTHMASIRKRSGYKLYQLHRIRTSIDTETALTIYKHCILPSLEYCSFILDSSTHLDQKSLQTMQNRGLRKCLQIGNPRDITRDALHLQCKVQTLIKRRDTQLLMHIYKLSKSVDNLVIRDRVRTRGDSKVKFKTRRVKLQVIKKSPLYRGLILWDSLEHTVQKLATRQAFKTCIVKIDFTQVKLRHANMT